MLARPESAFLRLKGTVVTTEICCLPRPSKETQILYSLNWKGREKFKSKITEFDFCLIFCVNMGFILIWKDTSEDLLPNMPHLPICQIWEPTLGKGVKYLMIKVYCYAWYQSWYWNLAAYPICLNCSEVYMKMYKESIYLLKSTPESSSCSSLIIDYIK